MPSRVRTFDGTTWLSVAAGPVPASLATETRLATDWPFTADAWCNTPIGSGATYGQTSDALTQAIRGGGVSVSCAGFYKVRSSIMNINSAMWSAPVNYTAASDPLWTCHERNKDTGVEVDTFTVQAPDPITVAGELPLALQGNLKDGSGNPLTPDSPMVILSSDGLTSQEMYQWGWPAPSNSWPTRNVYTQYKRHQTFDLKNDPGYGAPGYGASYNGLRAASVPILAGLIRTWEIQRAATDPSTAIRHALAVALQGQQYVRDSQNGGIGYQWPAWNRDYYADRAIQELTPPNSGTFTLSGGGNSYTAAYNISTSDLLTAITAWGGNYSAANSAASVSGTAGSVYDITLRGAAANTLSVSGGGSITAKSKGTLYADSGVVMGQLMALDPSVNISALGLSTNLGIAIAYAMRDYGAYAVDTSGTMTCYAEVAAASLFSSTGVGTDLGIIRANLLPITNASQTNPGGGGTPRRPAAPAFA